MLRVRLLPLSALSLLLMQGACTPEEPFSATGDAQRGSRYRIGGQAVRCRYVTASAGFVTEGSDPRETVQITDRVIPGSPPTVQTMRITLSAAPHPAVEDPVLSVEFEKPAGTSDAHYHVAGATYLPGPGQALVFYRHLAGTLTETSPGIFAGTFASKRPETLALLEGVFAGARLPQPGK